ncbi:MAG: hypothetical protein KF861_00650 [Planctomycetaceae bacterium]|nr:hypothetical protein [Planctomycetaceae bacterium]
MNDPLIDTIHRFREQHAARFNFSMSAICRDLRERQSRSGHEVVSREPKQLVDAEIERSDALPVNHGQ